MRPQRILLIIATLFLAHQCCTITKRIFGKHVAALVLARGGSKGIPLKNLAKISNKTLLRISLEAVLPTGFDSVWVSTENEKIFQEATKVSDLVNVHWRAEETATDVATSIEAVQEFLLYRPEVDFVALVQCTSPFVKTRYLLEGLKAIRQGADCAFSVTSSSKKIWTKSEGATVPLNFDPKNRKRRQESSGEFYENGMFYFAKRRLIEQEGLLQSNRCHLVLVSEVHSLEVD